MKQTIFCRNESQNFTSKRDTVQLSPSDISISPITLVHPHELTLAHLLCCFLSNRSLSVSEPKAIELLQSYFVILKQAVYV
jgi:hypothetical protein